MAFERLSDESVLRFYENIREQLVADMSSGNRYRLMGETAKQRAKQLREVIERRRLRYNPIEWHDD